MEQLVGRTCARCQRRISSITEAEFCHACGLPVHYWCRIPAELPSPAHCERCGAKIGDSETVRQRLSALHRNVEQRRQQVELRDMYGHDYGKRSREGRGQVVLGAMLIIAGVIAAAGSWALSGGATVVVFLGLMLTGLILVVKGSSSKPPT